MAVKREYVPEFYDPAKAMEPIRSALAGDVYVSRTQHRQVASRDPEDYLLLWDERMRREEQHTRKLVEMYVTIHRRFRGVTISDQFGYFGTRPETQGRWIDYDPDLDGEVHPINIVRPDIKANTAALLQANVQIDAEPANPADARLCEQARRVQHLIDYFERGGGWEKSERTILFDAMQKEGTCLIENYFDESLGYDHRVIVPTQYLDHYAVFECQGCGVKGVKEIAADLSPTYEKTSIPCPGCDQSARATVEAVSNFDLVENGINSKEISHRIWSGFNFVIDRRGARTKGLAGARWLATMELVERAELEDAYPQHDFNAPYEWSYSLKCQHALANADWSILYSSWQPTAEAGEWDIFQKNTRFLHETAYRSYLSPSDWEFRGKDGRLKFRIRRGETWAEAVRNSFGGDVRGFRFVTVNEQLIDIEAPPEHEPNFRKCFTDAHWLRDSGSYLSVPHWDSVQMQDDITLFNTLKTETAARNSVEPVFYNSSVFDRNDFTRDYIPSKNGALDSDFDITKAVMKPAIARSADGVNEHLMFLLGLHEKQSDRTPALRGESQPGQPAAAQRQQLEQSYGMLTPATQSYAAMRVDNVKQKIRMAFETWPLERFQRVASLKGEQWNEVDVKSLVQVDLARDVIIDYATGSEIPQGNQVREMKFYNGLAQVMPLLTGGMVSPQVIQQILKKIDEFADFEFDLSGLETVEALAQKRYADLVEACMDYADLTRRDIDAYKARIESHMPVIDPATDLPAIDEATGQPVLQPITAFDLLIEEILAISNVFISPIEDIEGQKRYFVEATVRELAKPKPNLVLAEAMTYLVTNINEIVMEAQMAATMANSNAAGAGQSPDQVGAATEAEAAELERQAQIEASDKEYDRELEKLAVAEASKENDREFERERMAHELMLADSS